MQGGQGLCGCGKCQRPGEAQGQSQSRQAGRPGDQAAPGAARLGEFGLLLSYLQSSLSQFTSEGASGYNAGISPRKG
jgi:hypothetical protein